MEKKYEGVADTLFIPLEGRIHVSRNFPDFFCDKRAIELEPCIPSGSIRATATQYQHFAAVCRCYNMDQMVKDFLAKHADTNVVYLGCGLETAYDRIGNRKAHFYQLDLPDVADARRKVLGCAANETIIGGDLFDLHWTEVVDCTLPTIIIASGVFQYFENEKTYQLVRTLKMHFPKGELVFDITDKSGLNYVNRFVRKTGNASAMMYGYVDRTEDFTTATGTWLVECRPFYVDARKRLRGRLRFSTRVMMWCADRMGRTKILHIRLC